MSGADVWKAVAPIAVFVLLAGIFGWSRRKDRTFLKLIGDIVG